MQAFEDHKQWNAVKDVCSRLTAAGHEALLAGGCVRDLLMHRQPNDFDVATDATPDQIEALFEKSIAVGKAFGVIILPYDDFQIEVATFREDLEYRDGRRPEGVKFSTAKADSQRRDFTVNALFFNPKTDEIIDYVDGRKDIASKILRTVGKPDHRFDEDKLRILRAIRFSAQLNFEIAPETLQAVKDRARDVSVVSRERIRDEVQKLLKTEHRRRGLEALIDTGVFSATFPDLAAVMGETNTREAWLESFDRVENADDETALLALFLWPLAIPMAVAVRQGSKDVAKAIAEDSIRSLKLENQMAAAIESIFKNLDDVLNPSRVRKGELAFLLTKPFAPSLLLVADTLARANARPHELDDRTAWNDALKAARPDGHNAAEPLATGKDLIAMGLKPGPKMGDHLHEIFLRQLEGEIQTRADIELYIKQNAGL